MKLAEKVMNHFESAEGDAKRKAAAKAQMDNKIEKLRRENEKMQKTMKNLPGNDPQYDKLHDRLYANHGKIRKLKDHFAKTWSK